MNNLLVKLHTHTILLAKYGLVWPFFVIVYYADWLNKNDIMSGDRAGPYDLNMFMFAVACLVTFGWWLTLLSFFCS